MPSPAGIFADLGYTLIELQGFQKTFAEQILFGNVVSVSGGAKGEGKQFQMTPQQGLIEVKYAIEKLTNTLPSRNVTSVLPGCHPRGGIL